MRCFIEGVSGALVGGASLKADNLQRLLLHGNGNNGNDLLIVHVLIGASVIGLVLIQQGKGADAGPPLVVALADSLRFSGRRGFPQKLTAGLAALFFATSLTLAVIAKQKAKRWVLWLTRSASSRRTICDSRPVAPKTVD